MNAFSVLESETPHSGKLEKEIAFSASFWNCSLVSMAAPRWRLVGLDHVDLPEARGAASVADAVDLHGLAFAVVGRAELLPVGRAGDSVAGLPEIGGAG